MWKLDRITRFEWKSYIEDTGLPKFYLSAFAENQSQWDAVETGERSTIRKSLERMSRKDCILYSETNLVMDNLWCDVTSRRQIIAGIFWKALTSDVTRPTPTSVFSKCLFFNWWRYLSGLHRQDITHKALSENPKGKSFITFMDSKAP